MLSAGAEGPTLLAVPVSALLTGLLLGTQLDGNWSVAAFMPVSPVESAHRSKCHATWTCPVNAHYFSLTCDFRTGLPSQDQCLGSILIDGRVIRPAERGRGSTRHSKLEEYEAVHRQGKLLRAEFNHPPPPPPPSQPPLCTWSLSDCCCFRSEHCYRPGRRDGRWQLYMLS